MSSTSPCVLVVIPAHNEAESVASVIRSVRSVRPSNSILVVDDGSTDDTAVTASRAGATVASHAVNLGVGAAMRTGFLYASGKGFDAVVQVDADGQHEPGQLSSLVEGLETVDIVIGSRFAGPSQYSMSWIRRLAIRLLSWVVSIHCRTTITDATSGFRAAGPRAISVFATYYPSEYLGDTVESLVLAGKVGLTVKEVPVTMSARRGGRPSQTTMSGALHLLRAVFVGLQSFIRRAPTTIEVKEVR